MSHPTKEAKNTIFKEFGGNENNTGSVKGQVALCTERINHISGHLKKNEKDHSNRRALLKLVGKRKRLLTYLSRHDLEGYRNLLARLNIRK